MHALVVDDSQTMRMIVRRFGEELGLEITEAGDGAEGLDRLEAMGVPELIVADWKMPTMSGSEFVKIVRARPLYDRTFILMLTSESGTNEILQALKWGVNDYLAKPCTGLDIRERLESIVGRITESCSKDSPGGSHGEHSA